MSSNMPTVFLSYSHDSQQHKDWVLRLAAKLQQEAGVRAIVDALDYHRQQNLNTFMLLSIERADFVLVICTPNYKAKADDFSGSSGVGTETIINVGSFYQAPEKFIAIVRERTPDRETPIPIYLRNFRYFDFSDSDSEEQSFHALIHELWGVPRFAIPPPRTPPALQTALVEPPKAIDNTAFRFLVKANLDKMKRELSLAFPVLDSTSQVTQFITPYLADVPRQRLNEGTPITSAEQLSRAFLADPAKKAWILLGDYGCGKSTYCYKLALDSFSLNATDNTQDVLPIYLALRNQPHLQYEQMDSWLTNLLRAYHGSSEELRFTWDIASHTLRSIGENSRLLLILDGLDETRVDLEHSADDNCRKIIHYFEAFPCQLVLTSRTNFLSTFDVPVIKVHKLSFSSIPIRQSSERRSDVGVSFFTEFSAEDVRNYFRRMDSDGEQILSRIEQSPHLMSIAAKPIFANLIAQVGAAGLGERPDATQLYSTIIFNWVDTNRELSELSDEQVIMILEEIAMYMFISSQREIRSDLLEKHLAVHFGRNAVKTQASLDITNCTFLVKGSDNTYMFSHNTFLEFLVAARLKRRLLEYDNHGLYIRLLTDPMNQFLIELLAQDDDAAGLIAETSLKGMEYLAEDPLFDELAGEKIPNLYVDSTPVTNAQYQVFLALHPDMLPPTPESKHVLLDLCQKDNADWVVGDVDAYIKACARFSWDPATRSFPHGEADLPVTYVSYFDAWAFARWAGKALPTFNEWLKAAAWDPRNQRLTPFGRTDEAISPDTCNFGGHYGGPTSVRRFSEHKSAYGCVDMTGNVSEWNADWFDSAHFYRIIAGGAWHMALEELRCLHPHQSLPNIRRNFVGFRCIKRIS